MLFQMELQFRRVPDPQGFADSFERHPDFPQIGDPGGVLELAQTVIAIASVYINVYRAKQPLLGVNTQSLATEPGKLGKSPAGNKISHQEDANVGPWGQVKTITKLFLDLRAFFPQGISSISFMSCSFNEQIIVILR